MPEAVRNKLLRRTGRAVKAHYKAAARFGFLDNLATAASLLGSVLVLVGSLYVELVKNRLEPYGLIPLNVLTGLGLVIFALTAGQAVWRWRRLSEDHRRIASSYAKIRRSIEAAQDNEEALAACRAELDEAAENSILVPSDIWKWSDKEYSKGALNF